MKSQILRLYIVASVIAFQVFAQHKEEPGSGGHLSQTNAPVLETIGQGRRIETARIAADAVQFHCLPETVNNNARPYGKAGSVLRNGDFDDRRTHPSQPGSRRAYARINLRV